jgi:hypothetical protein
LIGGRFKKLASQATDPREKSSRLNQAIDAYEQGMQADLNDYYPSSNLSRLYRQRAGKGDTERARSAATVAMLACERSMKVNPSDEWVRPTLLGMAFDAGNASKAEDLAAQVTKEGAVAWKLQTTLDDLQTAVNLQDDPKKKDHLQGVLTTLKAQLPAEV